MRAPPGSVVPFWFWNGEVDERRIETQLARAAAEGLSGLAVHARAGNRIPYLSPRWLELVRHAALVARRHGLSLWLYDEEDYPSGTAGRSIQAAEPALRQRVLVWSTAPAGELATLPEPVAWFQPDGSPVDPQDLANEQPALLFHVQRADRYVDTLDPASCHRFLASTHEVYAAALGDLLGSVVTAVYTDDVNYHLQDRKGLGWTADLPGEFRRRRGRDLLPLLPALVGDLPGAAQARIDFHRTLLELFLERWVVPQRAWCAAHGVAFLGHLRGDEGPLWMLSEQCGAAMPFYAAEDVPSIDDYLLRARDGGFARRERTDHGLAPILLYRQAASVADQYGDGIVNSEVGASLGWDLTPAELHRHLLFEQLMGINQLTPHAVSACTAGVAKRDHPPSFAGQLPWWELAPAVVARWSRLCAWLREGQAAVEVVVLFPTSAAWAALRGADRRPAPGLSVAADAVSCDDLESGLAALALALVRARVPFHFADELLLAQHGAVADSQLQLGHMRYVAVVVPPAATWLPDTQAVLERCRAAGVEVHEGLEAVAVAAVLPSPMPGLQSGPGELVLHVRQVGGERRYLLGNCGDADLAVSPAPGPGGWRIEALEGGVVYRGPLPAAGLVLPRGACWHVRRDDGPVVPTAVPPGPHTRAITDWRWRLEQPTVAWWDAAEDASGSWRRLRDLDPTTCGRLTIPIEVPPGVRLRGLIGEQLARLSPTWDNRPLPSPDGHHPASPDLSVISLEAVAPGRHRLALDPSRLSGRIEDVGLLLDGMVELEREAGRGWLPRLRPWREPPAGADLARHGLPFHWGPVVAETTLDLDDPTGWRWLDLGSVAVAAQVLIDGVVVAELDHPPWLVPLAGRLRRGPLQLIVRVFGTAQNLFGPHRNPLLGRTVSAPGEGEAQAPEDAYHLAPFGLHGPVLLRS